MKKMQGDTALRQSRRYDGQAPVCQNFSTVRKLTASTLRSLIAVFSLCILVAGCTAIQVATDKISEKTLGIVGIKLPENPNAPRPPKTIKLKIETANDLNAGEDGQGLSTIFRLYKLRDHNTFLAAPYSIFGNPERERASLGTDIVEVRELILSPGQVLELNEKISPETAYLGVVTLYRMPSPRRWRFAFAAADAEKYGITLGLHACAMTATTTPPVGMALSESALLSSARCK